MDETFSWSLPIFFWLTTKIGEKPAGFITSLFFNKFTLGVWIPLLPGVILLPASWWYLRKVGVDLSLSGSDEDPAISTKFRRFLYNTFLMSARASIAFAFLLSASLILPFIRFLLPIILISTTHWWFVPISVIIAILLFKLRQRHRVVYGVIELIAGLVAIINSTKIEISEVARIVSISGGIYIIVRALDNIGQGIILIKNTSTSSSNIIILVWMRLFST